MTEPMKNCPNCGTPATVQADGVIYCATCNGSFVIENGEARLLGIGDFEKLQADNRHLRAQLADEKKQAEELRQAVARSNESDDTPPEEDFEEPEAAVGEEDEDEDEDDDW